MNVSRDDLKRLRVPLALALLLSALGVACLATSGYYLDEAKSAREASRSAVRWHPNIPRLRAGVSPPDGSRRMMFHITSPPAM